MTKLEERWQITREALGKDKLSVIMPVYNLAGEIAENLDKTAALFEQHGVNVQLVPVDDGSSDGTREVLEKFAYRHLYRWKFVTITPVALEKNGGKGAALRAGFEQTTGKYVMLLDGDLDIKPKQTPFFFEQMVRKNADVVIGSKRHKRSVVQYPWHRRLVSWVYFTLVRIFIGLPITDTQTGMKLFKREVLGEALERMLVKNYAFDLELLAIAHSRGAVITEAPVVIKFGNKFGALKPSTVRTMAIDSLAIFYRLRLLKYYANVEVPPPLKAPPKISVVIACPGNSRMLGQCLAALEAQTYTNWEAIILPDEIFFPETGSAKVRIVPTGKIRPAEKRNIGIKEATGEVVAFIDDDAYPDVHWLEYAVKYFGDRRIGAVGGPGVTPPDDPFLAKQGGRIYANPLVSGNFRYRYVAGGIRRDVDDYPSCNLLVRTGLLKSLGGYRTSFWPGEDTLLCKDIVDSGYRIVYDPWVIVFHHRREIFGAHLRQLCRYAFHRGYFCKRFPSNSLRASYFIPSAFTLYVAFMAVICFMHMFTGSAGADMGVIGAMLAPLAFYFALVLATSFSLDIKAWLLCAAGVFLTHVAYGIYFLCGLMATRAPCEFIGQDKAK